MAIVAVYTHENCPGVPKGATVRIHDDCFAEDQEAAWAHARAVHARIYFNQQLRALEAERKKANEEAQNSEAQISEKEPDSRQPEAAGMADHDNGSDAGADAVKRRGGVWDPYAGGRMAGE